MPQWVVVVALTVTVLSCGWWRGGTNSGGGVGIQLASAKVVQGEIITSSSNWLFLSRFCFFSRNGKFIYEIFYPKVSFAIKMNLLINHYSQDLTS